LQHRQPPDPGITDQVPGKTGEKVPAQPLRQSPQHGEGEYAGKPAQSQPVQRQRDQTGEQAEQRRQTGRGERHHPPESPDVGQQGEGYPVQAE
jgi:hypothetical protein